MSLWAVVIGAGVAVGSGEGGEGGGERPWPELRGAGVVRERGYDREEVVLARRVIDTRGAAERYALSGRVAEKMELEEGEKVSARGVAPYIVRFNGGVGEKEREMVRARGAEIYSYLPHDALLVGCAPGQVGALARLKEVRWIGAYRREDKLQRAVAEFVAKGEEAVRKVRIVTFVPEDAERVAGEVKAAGGRVEDVRAGEDRGYVRAEVTPGMIAAMSELAEVEWIEPYVAPRLLNNVAVQAARMNVWNVWTNYGITGKGQVVAVCDTGLDTGNLATMHPDFTNRIRAAHALGRAGDWSDPDGHGTHVCGSVLGNGSGAGGTFRGLAYEAEVIMQSVLDSGGNLGGLPSDLNNLYRQVYTNGARVHSDSWGVSVNGEYTSESRATDQFMWNNKDMLIVFAAGNEGVDGNGDGVIDLDSMSAPGTAKNVLTVGATENQRTSGGYSTYRWGTAWPADYPSNPIKDDYISRPWDGVNQGLAAFSSRGPCDDGRVKPDVCAPGTDIISCRSRAPGAGTGWGVHNTLYVYMGGTSMATPLTAGAAALARQYLIERRGITNPSAAVVKATLVNGAKSLTPGQYGTGVAREIPAQPRPNNVEGWGQVNVEAALFPPAGCTSLFYDTYALTTGGTNTYLFTAPGTNKLCITLAWTDYQATLAAGIKLMNDLDLVVVTPEGDVVYGNRGAGPDRLNNVEGIDFRTAAAGVYTIRVTGHNVPQGPQPYALVVREDRGEAAALLRYAPSNVVFYGSGTAALIISNAGTAVLAYQVEKPTGAYEVKDSDEAGGPVYSWIDISGSGTSVTLADDGETGLLNMPFGLPFFGTLYHQFMIGANGGIAFASGDISYDNTALPSASAPGPFLAVFWDDLNPASGGQIYYHTNAARVVVSWIGVPRYGTTEYETFQAILYASGEIVYQYKSMTGTLTSCTIGIQKTQSGPAVQRAYNQAYVKNNLALRFAPGTEYDWLSVAPTNGSVGAGGTSVVTITCDATGKTDGVYNAVLTVTHNGQEPARQVNVTMVVPEGSVLAVMAGVVGWVVRRGGRCRCA